jgi:hypothetical protein
MNVSIRNVTALGFILTVPLFALPAHGVATDAAKYKPIHHRVSDVANARALASPAMPVAQPRDADGLSRNDEECNMGCIDH